MSAEEDQLRGLLRLAFDEGRNGRTSFQEYYDRIGLGQIVSSVAILATSPKVRLESGTVVEFADGDYVVAWITYDGRKREVHLQDRDSWTRERAL